MVHKFIGWSVITGSGPDYGDLSNFSSHFYYFFLSFFDANDMVSG